MTNATGDPFVHVGDGTYKRKLPDGVAPLYDKLVVLTDEKQNMTRGGIALPDNARNRDLPCGVVVAVGPGVLLNTGVRVPLDIQVGDRVHFNAVAVNPISIDGTLYVMIRQNDVYLRDARR